MTTFHKERQRTQRRSSYAGRTSSPATAQPTPNEEASGAVERLVRMSQRDFIEVRRDQDGNLLLRQSRDDKGDHELRICRDHFPRLGSAPMCSASLSLKPCARTRRYEPAPPHGEFPQWAALAGLADDGRPLAVARALIAQGDGPQVVQVRRRRRTDAGVRLRDHRRWERTK